VPRFLYVSKTLFAEMFPEKLATIKERLNSNSPASRVERIHTRRGLDQEAAW